MRGEHPSTDELFAHLHLPSAAVEVHLRRCADCRASLHAAGGPERGAIPRRARGPALVELAGGGEPSPRERPLLTVHGREDLPRRASSGGAERAWGEPSALGTRPSPAELAPAAEPPPPESSGARPPAPSAARAWIGAVLLGAAATVAALSFGTARTWDDDRGAAVPALVHEGDNELFRLAEGERVPSTVSGPLRLAVGATLFVEPRGDAVLRVLHARERRKEVAIDRGDAVVSISRERPQERFAVVTPHGTIKASGSRFRVQAGAGATTIVVREGALRFHDRAGGRVEISAGGALTAEAQGSSLRAASVEELRAFGE